MLIGIIGGRGAMGTLFRGVFERAGHHVICSGRTSELSNRKLAEQSDLVMVSVPIRSTVAVIDEIVPLLREDQILCDLTSLKVKPVQAMLASRAKVIGFHPMFGPTIPSLKNQIIIATPERCDPQTLESLLSTFRNEGARITITTPEHHDRMMAVVQGLAHFATLSMAETMRKLNIDLEDVLSFTSPVYRIEMGLIARILGQNSSLYGDILQCNPEVTPVLDAFEHSITDLRDIIRKGDPETFRRFFSENAEIFARYIPQGTRETDTMIDALVSR